jgi:hypothetical protein
LASISTVSFGLVSPSIVMALKVRSVTWWSRGPSWAVHHGVGCDHAEDGGHVRMHHARPLGDSTHRDLSSGRLDLDTNVLDTPIGRHDGAGDVDAAVQVCHVRCLTHARRDGFGRQLNADGTGGENQEGARWNVEGLFRRVGHGTGGLEACVSRARIGDLGVHDDAAESSWAFGEERFVVRDRRRADAILREDPRAGTRQLTDEHADVGCAVGSKSGRRSAGGKTRRRRDAAIGQRCQRGHRAQPSDRREVRQPLVQRGVALYCDATCHPETGEFRITF